MFSSQEIRQITFEKVVRGYRPEDVESFMEKIADEFEALANEKKEMEEQLYVLAEKIEQYKSEEESIKATLINAQKLGESIITESKQKADALIKDATIRKNDILSSAHEEISGHEENLARIKKEVSDFKISILSMYKQHIESLSAIPEVKREPQQPAQACEPQPVQAEQPVIQTAIAEEQSPADIQAVTEAAEINPTQEFKAPPKKIIDDYAFQPQGNEGFNNISTLFDK